MTGSRVLVCCVCAQEPIRAKNRCRACGEHYRTHGFDRLVAMTDSLTGRAPPSRTAQEGRNGSDGPRPTRGPGTLWATA